MDGKLLKRFISFVTLVAFVFTSVAPSYAQSVVNMPVPGTMVQASTAFVPAILRGMKVYSQEALRFDFIVDGGNSALIGDAMKAEVSRLVRYFLAALTTPEKDLWVNLSPYEGDRIIPDAFGKTEMGRDLLAQDYILKQLTSSLMYPENEPGKTFWKKIYAVAHEKYGTTDIPLDTFNKVWITPDEATVYVNGSAAVIKSSHLKVLLESDYLATQKQRAGSGEQGAENNGNSLLHAPGSMSDVSDSQELAKNVLREVVIPILEKEVNEGANFAVLRQIYQAMVLAAWFKRNLKESLVGRIYTDQNKVKGIDLAEPGMKDEIWKQYVEAFKKGAFNYIKEEADEITGDIIPRKYFSGGFAPNSSAVAVLPSSPEEMANLVNTESAVVADIALHGASPAMQTPGRKRAVKTPSVVSKIVEFVVARAVGRPQVPKAWFADMELRDVFRMGSENFQQWYKSRVDMFNRRRETIQPSPSNLSDHLRMEGNASKDIVAALSQIDSKERIIFEIGAGNTENIVALGSDGTNRDAAFVLGVDLFDLQDKDAPPDYLENASKFQKHELPAQKTAHENVGVFRGGADLISFLPDQSVSDIVLVMPAYGALKDLIVLFREFGIASKMRPGARLIVLTARQNQVALDLLGEQFGSFEVRPADSVVPELGVNLLRNSDYPKEFFPDVVTFVGTVLDVRESREQAMTVSKALTIFSLAVGLVVGWARPGFAANIVSTPTAQGASVMLQIQESDTAQELAKSIQKNLEPVIGELSSEETAWLVGRLGRITAGRQIDLMQIARDMRSRRILTKASILTTASVDVKGVRLPVYLLNASEDVMPDIAFFDGQQIFVNLIRVREEAERMRTAVNGDEFLKQAAERDYAGMTSQQVFVEYLRAVIRHELAHAYFSGSDRPLTAEQLARLKGLFEEIDYKGMAETDTFTTAAEYLAYLVQLSDGKGGRTLLASMAGFWSRTNMGAYVFKPHSPATQLITSEFGKKFKIPGYDEENVLPVSENADFGEELNKSFREAVAGLKESEIKSFAQALLKYVLLEADPFGRSRGGSPEVLTDILRSVEDIVAQMLKDPWAKSGERAMKQVEEPDRGIELKELSGSVIFRNPSEFSISSGSVKFMHEGARLYVYRYKNGEIGEEEDIYVFSDENAFDEGALLKEGYELVDRLGLMPGIIGFGKTQEWAGEDEVKHKGRYYLRVKPNGGKRLEEKGEALSSEELASVLEFFKKLFDNGVVPNYLLPGACKIITLENGRLQVVLDDLTLSFIGETERNPSQTAQRYSFSVPYWNQLDPDRMISARIDEMTRKRTDEWNAVVARAAKLRRQFRSLEKERDDDVAIAERGPAVTVGERFQAHGIAKTDRLEHLLDLLDNDVQPGEFSVAQIAARGGLQSAYNGSFMLVTDADKSFRSMDDAKYVIVGPSYYPMFQTLSDMYPGKVFIKAEDENGKTWGQVLTDVAKRKKAPAEQAMKAVSLVPYWLKEMADERTPDSVSYLYNHLNWFPLTDANPDHPAVPVVRKALAANAGESGILEEGFTGVALTVDPDAPFFSLFHSILLVHLKALAQASPEERDKYLYRDPVLRPVVRQGLAWLQSTQVMDELAALWVRSRQVSNDHDWAEILAEFEWRYFHAGLPFPKSTEMGIAFSVIAQMAKSSDGLPLGEYDHVDTKALSLTMDAYKESRARELMDLLARKPGQTFGRPKLTPTALSEFVELRRSDHDYGQSFPPFARTIEDWRLMLRLLSHTPKAQGHNSLHIGFSGFLNLDIMAERKSEFGILLDINDRTAELFKVLAEVITQEESVDNNEFAKAFDNRIAETGDYFRRGMALGGIIDSWLNDENSWLGNKDKFKHIRNMFVNERIVFFRADIRQQRSSDETENAFDAIAAWAEKHGVVVDTLYISNIYEWLLRDGETGGFFDNMLRVISEKTVLIKAIQATRPHVTLAYPDMVKMAAEDQAWRNEHAMEKEFEKGGIDLNSKNLQLNEEGDQINFSPAEDIAILAQDIDGFVPVVVNIAPLGDPLAFFVPMAGGAP